MIANFTKPVDPSEEMASHQNVPRAWTGLVSSTRPILRSTMPITTFQHGAISSTERKISSTPYTPLVLRCVGGGIQSVQRLCQWLLMTRRKRTTICTSEQEKRKICESQLRRVYCFLLLVFRVLFVVFAFSISSSVGSCINWS